MFTDSNWFKSLTDSDLFWSLLNSDWFLPLLFVLFLAYTFLAIRYSLEIVTKASSPRDKQNGQIHVPCWGVGKKILVFLTVFVILFCLGWILIFPKVALSRFQDYLRARKIKNMPAPVVVYNEVNGIRVYASKRAFDKGLLRHKERVLDKLEGETGPFVVQPSLVFVDKKGRTRLSEKELESVSGWFSDAEKIVAGCEIRKMIDIYVPFCTKSRKKREADLKMFSRCNNIMVMESYLWAGNLSPEQAEEIRRRRAKAETAVA